MAGSITNADILTALNQQIKAINDLILGVAGLELTCTASPGPVTVNVSCTCSGGAGAGSTLPSSTGDQGQTPPPGYTEPDPNTTDRKCKAANLIHDLMVGMVQKLAVLDVDQYVALGYTLTLGAVGAAIGSAVPVAGTLAGALIGAVAGAVLGIASQLITGGVLLDLSDLGIILSTEQESLVNALYNATDANGARAAYTAILSGAGATAVETAVISYALTNDLLNLLFFTIEQYEPTIDAYTGGVNCEYTPVLAWTFDTGADGWLFHDLTAPASYSIGTWSTDTPHAGGSAGHLRTTEHYVDAGGFGSYWEYLFPVGYRPVVGEDTILTVWYKTSQEGGYGKVQATMVFEDDSFVTTEAYLDTWSLIESPLINHADDWGKAIKALRLVATRTGNNTNGHIIDFDTVELAGTT